MKALLLLISTCLAAAAAPLMQHDIPGLVGWWTFNEGSGTNAYDYSGYGNTGYNTNSSITWTNGVMGGAFIPSITGFNCGSNTILQQRTLTLSTWAYSYGAQSNYTTLAVLPWSNDTGPTYSSYVIFLNPGNGGYSLAWFWLGNSGGASENVVNNACPSNTWVNIVGTFDGTNQLVYTNGVLASALVNANSILYSGVDLLSIGFESYYGNARRFNGIIDDVRIYNRALTPYEVQLLYGGGYGRGQP